ncbi:MAG: hypothetical protein LAT82_01120 [Nanoarchaeota archaeon]|nr:hypothetical protein [Nanoarchaeota archaeon]
MAIDFEEFLNKALASNSGVSDDIFEEELDETEEKEEEIINSISIEPILEQIKNLKEKALDTPEKFKEIYSKFEEFEKNYPYFFIDIQSNLYDNQSILKTKYLQDTLTKENEKVEKINIFFENQFKEVEELIKQNKFQNAHNKIISLNYEIYQIPQSYTKLKFNLLKKNLFQINNYYNQQQKIKTQLLKEYINSMKYILSQKNTIFSSINRTELDELIKSIQILFLKRRIEFDLYLGEYFQKFISFNNKLIEHRLELQTRCENDFIKYFTMLESKFQNYLEQKQVYEALVVLEVTHMLLKKETCYNQDLKITYFLKLIEYKKEINKLSYATKKGFSEEELTLCYAYSKLNLINLLNHSIIRFNKNEIKETINEIYNLENLKNNHKKLILNRIITKFKPSNNSKEKSNTRITTNVNTKK